MNTATLIILLHQLLFQGLFAVKNIALKMKLGVPIRGHNKEARTAILFLAGIIFLSLFFASMADAPGRFPVMPDAVATAICLLLLAVNLVLGTASLRDLGDSWRVGVIEEQRTELVEGGIYRFTRNPYFLAYLVMAVAYTVLLQNLVLLCLSAVCCGLVHAMVLKEERYLESVHGEAYRRYRKQVPRYLVL